MLENLYYWHVTRPAYNAEFADIIMTHRNAVFTVSIQRLTDEIVDKIWRIHTHCCKLTQPTSNEKAQLTQGLRARAPPPSECVLSSTRQISKKIRTFSRLRSSKVIDIGANRKHICNFLLVVNSNFGRILVSRTVSEIWPHIGRKSLPPLYSALPLRVKLSNRW